VAGSGGDGHFHWQVDIWAGLAFVPYLVWVTVAAAPERVGLDKNRGASRWTSTTSQSTGLIATRRG
jgi:hypothetical protein